MITAINESVAATEGEYTRSVSSDTLPSDSLTDAGLGSERVTVGYEVIDASAE